MIPLTTNEWLLLILAFLLGLFLGMAFCTGRKWKTRYREEVTRREDLEAENRRLHREIQTLDAGRHPVDRPGTRHDDDRRV